MTAGGGAREALTAEQERERFLIRVANYGGCCMDGHGSDDAGRRAALKSVTDTYDDLAARLAEAERERDDQKALISATEVRGLLARIESAEAERDALRVMARNVYENLREPCDATDRAAARHLIVEALGGPGALLAALPGAGDTTNGRNDER